MKQTRVSTLIGAAVATGILAFGICAWMVRAGAPVPISTTQFLLMLPTVAAILIILALPIFRYRAAIKAALENPKDPKVTAAIKRVDGFYALRVAMLSKAVSVAGSMFVGWHLGVLINVLSSPQWTAGSLWRCIFGVLGAGSMIAAGIIVERSCKIPPDAESDVPA